MWVGASAIPHFEKSQRFSKKYINKLSMQAAVQEAKDGMPMIAEERKMKK
jgi:hypothetical protein